MPSSRARRLLSGLLWRLLFVGVLCLGWLPSLSHAQAVIVSSSPSGAADSGVAAAAQVSTSGTVATTNEYVTTGGAGVTRTLPAALSATMVREFWVIKVDAGAGALTLAPFSGDLLNGSAAALSTATQWAGFYVKEIGVSPGRWYVESIVKQVDLSADTTNILPGAKGGTGVSTTGLSGVAQVTGGAWAFTNTPTGVGGTFCASTGGNTNNSASGSGTFFAHSLTCTIPANTLTANRVAQVCAGWNTTTGSAAITIITQFKAGATVLYVPLQTSSPTLSRTNNGSSWCLQLMAAAAPGPSVNVYTNPVLMPGFEISGPYSNTIAQPVALATNADLVLSFETKWNTVGTGTTTITQATMVGRFLN